MTSRPSVKKQRFLLRAFNGVAGTLEALGRTRPGFVKSEVALHEAARRSVGYDDFGDDRYLEPLRTLLEAYDAESRLTPFGHLMARQGILGALKNRLVAEHERSSSPTIRDVKIRRPIFILGLPRTGTTALHQLMGQDPGIQTLEYWLAAAPHPRPPLAQWSGDPRFKQAVRDLQTMYYLDPSLKAIHLMTADGPEECRHLLCQQFTDDTFDCNATIPSYSAWYAGADMHAAYEHHRRLLQMIGSRDPDRRWVLKYPMHMRNLRTLFDVYPDACIVYTHRDPVKVLPSICSLVSGWRGIYETDVDAGAIARWQSDLWADGLDKGMQVRGERDDSQFFDLHFREVQADPIGAVRRIYKHFDVEITDEAERRWGTWRAANPPGKHGAHNYGLADFGLEPSAVRDRYAAYLERFAVETER